MCDQWETAQAIHQRNDCKYRTGNCQIQLLVKFVSDYNSIGENFSLRSGEKSVKTEFNRAGTMRYRNDDCLPTIGDHFYSTVSIQIVRNNRIHSEQLFREHFKEHKLNELSVEIVQLSFVERTIQKKIDSKMTGRVYDGSSLIG